MCGNIITGKMDYKIQCQLFKPCSFSLSQRNTFLRNYTGDYLFGFLDEILGAEEGASYS